MSDEVAAEVLRQLGQQPRLDGGVAAWFPSFLAGTPTGELLVAINTEARGAGLYLKRDVERGTVFYRAFHCASEVVRCEVKLPEAKTSRSETYCLLTEFRQAVQEAGAAVIAAGLLPTVPIYGDFFLTEKQWQLVTDWGALYDRATSTWFSPEPTLGRVRGLLCTRACCYLGRYSELSSLQRYALRGRFAGSKHKVQDDHIFALTAFADEIRASLGLKK